MFRAVLIYVFLTCTCWGEEVVENYRWPASYLGKQKIAVKSLDPSSLGTFGFETERFRFYSDTKLANADWRSIMIVCEGLRGAMESLPLDLVKSDEQASTRAVVRILSEEATYHQAGGLEQTVGTYHYREKQVLIWSRGLIEPDPDRARFRLSKSRQYDLLVHELVHQVTAKQFRRMPTWFSEGIAEYLAAAHHSPGQYSFRDPAAAIREHVKKYLGEVAKLDQFKIIPLKLLTSLDGHAWAQNTRDGEGHGPFLKYVSAVLLVHYFCHLDPERNRGEVVRKFLGALRDGQPASRATVEQLLRGRSLKSIEGEIQQFWRGKGLRVEFRS
ncbi:MAG: hypothetical protein ACI8XO_000650 [Verrucomicrobiales bacterium]|jgi:hypothetical protein